MTPKRYPLSPDEDDDDFLIEMRAHGWRVLDEDEHEDGDVRDQPPDPRPPRRATDGARGNRAGLFSPLRQPAPLSAPGRAGTG